ncbi:hypothetical protein MHYP_G00036700 [Metynnis hypsauchen]
MLQLTAPLQLTVVSVQLKYSAKLARWLAKQQRSAALVSPSPCVSVSGKGSSNVFLYCCLLLRRKVEQHVESTAETEDFSTHSRRGDVLWAGRTQICRLCLLTSISFFVSGHAEPVAYVLQKSF